MHGWPAVSEPVYLPKDVLSARVEFGFFLGLVVVLTILLLFVLSGVFQPIFWAALIGVLFRPCLLYTSPSPRDVEESRMPSSA